MGNTFYQGRCRRQGQSSKSCSHSSGLLLTLTSGSWAHCILYRSLATRQWAIRYAKPNLCQSCFRKVTASLVSARSSCAEKWSFIMPSLSNLVKCFVTRELMRWPGIVELYGEFLRATPVFSIEKRWDDLHTRVIEHVRILTQLRWFPGLLLSQLEYPRRRCILHSYHAFSTNLSPWSESQANGRNDC